MDTMDSDLDPNAFLQSVRELKEKRQKEDNERYEQLQAQIASSRLARKLGEEREREMTGSPPASPAMSPRRERASPSSGMPTRSNTFTRQPRAGRPMSVDLSPTRAGSARPMSMVSIPEQGSPLPSRDSQRFAPPDNEPASVGRTMSSAQSRLDRPASPTKGMGGFVQSAMLRRNDSVNKRWSTTEIPPALGRHNPNASTSSPSDRLPITPNLDGRESRPSSSHGTPTATNLNNASEPESRERTGRHSRSRSVASFSAQEAIPEGITSPPLSPNKRWSRSPTKSWLESALARPESPKPSPSPQLNQPSWMAEISKAKQRNSVAENAPSLDVSEGAKTPASPAIGQSLLKRSALRDGGAESPTNRNVTPPTKAKPASLVSKQPLADPVIDQTMSTPLALKPTPTKPETKQVEKEPVKISEETPEKKTPNPVYQRPTVSTPTPSLPKLDDNEPAVKFPAYSSPRPSTPKSPEVKQAITPKTDFRSGLKSRSGTVGANAQQEPEFKAIFGKLKKAHTDKFVAPDELKDNILRGKAGLSLSAGPQKSERRDELKESLLQKKEEMKAKAVPDKPAEVKPSPKPTPVPEAINIRKNLGRSSGTLNVPAPDKHRRDITPEALSFHKNLRGKPKAPAPGNSGSVLKEADSKPTPAPFKEQPVEKVATPEMEKQPEPKPEEQVRPAVQERVKPAVQEQSKPAVSNKIADRFNPALAGLLARGPPQASNSSSPRSGSPAVSSRNTQHEEPSDGAELTHMTKSRAKGPKRRKPKSSAAPAATATISSPPPVEAPIIVTKRVASFEPVKNGEASPSSPTTTKAPVQPRPKSAAVRAASINLSKPMGDVEKQKTPTPTKTTFGTPTSVKSDKLETPTSRKPSLERSATNGSEKSKPLTPSKPSFDNLRSVTPVQLSKRSPSTSSSMSAQSISKIISPAVTTRQSSGSAHTLPIRSVSGLEKSTKNVEKPLPSVNNAEADKENQSYSVKNAASMWGRAAQQTPPQKRSEPVELPTRKDEEAAMASAGLLSNSPLRYQATPPKLGLGISDNNITMPKRVNSGERTPPSAGAPPKPKRSSRIVSGQLSMTKDLPRAPHDLPAARDLIKFFGELPRSNNKLQLDTLTVLRSRSGEPDVMKTLRSSIQEIKADGTLLPLPGQQEHMLYEESMYLCTHVFGSTNGARMTEVYLWCGDGIQEDTIQETQAHARRIAKEAGNGQKSTQLYIVDQAREPAGFFQALGGIVITRRGSRAESSTRPYMLCGRPHMGHIAFDEVNRSKSSLYSEYPCILARPITLQETKVWLWKGSGCGPAAIGSARLISMDLNPGGEIIEIDEGHETAEFLELLGDQHEEICKSPALWSGTGDVGWEHSSLRLFRVDVAAPVAKQTATSYFTSFLSRRPSWPASRSSPTERRPTSTSSGSGSGAEFEASISEIAPFTQDDLEPEHCYVLDAGYTVLVLPGPLLSKQKLWGHGFVQALLFAHDYAILCAGTEDRPGVPVASVVVGGLPREVEVKFRRWEDRRGVWGVGGMMAGTGVGSGEEVESVGVREALEVCCGV